VRIEFNTKGTQKRAGKAVGFVVMILGLGLLVSSGRSFAQMKAMPEKPSKPTLYQRMGGYDVLAGVLDDFLHQLGTDPAFKRFGGGRSMDSLHRTRQLVLDQLCNLTGGPCVYIGRDMKTAHAGLDITPAEWDSSIEKFKVALNDQKVGEQEQKEFIAIIQKLRPDIVAKPKAQEAMKEKAKAGN
jgi:hemoglobin